MKRIFSILGALFLVFVAACTIYARDTYQKSLPYVQIAANESGTFYYESDYEGSIQKLDSNRALPDFADDYIYSTTASLPADMTYMVIGDNAELIITGSEQERFYGRIISLIYEYGVDGKTLENILMEIGFTTALNSIDNKTISIKIKKESIFMDCILPKEALFENQTDQCVYLVKKRDGVWGAEYYVERMKINILASTESKISISNYRTLEYPVVVHSDEPIQNGQAVRLYP